MVSFAKKSNPVLNESSLNLTKYYMSFLQCVHSVKNREVHSSKKNSWNQLFSNFFRKNVEFTKSLSRIWRVNFCNFHTHTFELKISSKQLHTITTSNRLLIWRKNSVRCFSFFHTVLHTVEKWKIYSYQSFFPSNQLFSNLFSKCVAFTKYLPKKRESNFL